MSSNLDVICRFISETATRPLKPEVSDLAKKCLVDWFAVSLAALSDTAPTLVRQQMLQWGTRGQAMSLYGDRGAAGPMALVNGTLSHSLDYDDMHFGSAYHASGPTLAAALAIAMDRGLSGQEVLNAFVTGYEVGATLGEAGVGPRLLAAGWHSTGVLGHFSSTSATAVLLRLSSAQIAHALGLAATQAAGLQASGGTMAKPFHVGKATMNGVMSAELALMGMDSNTSVIDDAQSGLLGCLFQTPSLATFDRLGYSWQIEGNTFKPYASCQLTHAPYETARGMADKFTRDRLKEIRIHVNPLAKKVAGRDSAATPMQGKFSIGFCVALGLMGYEADISGFTDMRVGDAELRELTAKARIVTSESVERWSAVIELDYGEGQIKRGETQAVLGSPSRPLSWGDLDEKFMNATGSILGDRAKYLLDVLHRFEEGDSMAEVSNIIGQVRHALVS